MRLGCGIDGKFGDWASVPPLVLNAMFSVGINLMQFFALINKIMIDFSYMIERLKEIRSQSGLSQELFAQKMGVSRRTQAGYEAGENRPSTSYLQKIAEAGFDVNYLLTGERRGETLSAEDSEVLRLWHAAPLLLVRHAALNVLATGQTPETANRIGNITGSIISGGIKQGGG